MKIPVPRAVSRFLPLLTALGLSGCLTFAGLSEAPEYAGDTLVLIREAEDGSRDYVAAMGETETTVFEAVLTAGGDWYLEYRYLGAKPLNVRELVVYTDSTGNSFTPETPWQGKDPDGRILETDEIPVPRHLFRFMAESTEPTINLAGEYGTVILVLGDSGRRRLEEILSLDPQ